MIVTKLPDQLRKDVCAILLDLCYGPSIAVMKKIVDDVECGTNNTMVVDLRALEELQVEAVIDLIAAASANDMNRWVFEWGKRAKSAKLSIN